MTKPLEKRVENFVDRFGLLAKWREDDEDFRQARGFTFVRHYREVLWGLNVLFAPELNFAGARKSFAEVLHQRMNLPCSFDEFHRWSRLAVLGHDLGKCGGEFQQMLVGMEVRYWLDFGGGEFGCSPEASEEMRERWVKEKRHFQIYRHEFLSALLMAQQPEIRAWFRQEAGSDRGFAYALCGAFGHHLKGDDDRAVRVIDERVLRRPFPDLPIYTDKLSVHLNEVLGTNLPGMFAPFPLLARLPAGNDLTKYQTLHNRLMEMRADPLLQGEDDKISSAIKWLVILADTFGSIGDKQGEGYEQTRARILDSVRRTWAPRRVDLQSRIAKKIGVGSSLFPVQTKCATLRKNLINIASTGGGKTVGSLVWANTRQLPLIYCAHTTDAATCFFSDYSLPSDHLRHSKAWIDLRFRSTHEDASVDLEDVTEAEEMIETLRGCDCDVTFTTADQVLGLMAFYRKSVMWLPYLLKAQVVFDEVGSYDPTMRAWYFRFLDWFNIPTAHLSATIPADTLEKIRGRLNEPRIVQDSRRKITDRQKIPNHRHALRRTPRYKVHILSSLTEAVSNFTPGTIWFANVVERAQDIARAHPDAVLYHSRFRAKDRAVIQKQVMQAFPTNRDVLVPLSLRVVATQAAEMALDISAHHLISEVAPPASIIQRLGRVNRQCEHEPVDVYFYLPDMPEHGLPYSSARRECDWMALYEEWASWLAMFQGQAISQDDLEEGFQKFCLTHPKQTQYKEAYTSMLQTSRVSVRDAIFTTPCLLKSDWDANPKMGGLDVAMLSVPVILTPKHRRYLYLNKMEYRRTPIVDGTIGTYDPRLGFMKN